MEGRAVDTILKGNHPSFMQSGAVVSEKI